MNIKQKKCKNCKGTGKKDRKVKSDRAKNKKIICLVTYWTQTKDAFFSSRRTSSCV